MSTKGRKSKPTQQKVTSGTLRQDRANPNEPSPEVTELVAPEWLPERARDAFNELARLLYGQRILTQLDEVALTLLCDQWAIYREARDYIDENGQYAVGLDSNGNTTYKNYPQMSTIATSYSNILRMLTEFGLTPSSRSKVSVKGGGEKDPFEEYMKKVN